MRERSEHAAVDRAEARAGGFGLHEAHARVADERRRAQRAAETHHGVSLVTDFFHVPDAALDDGVLIHRHAAVDEVDDFVEVAVQQRRRIELRHAE